MKHCETCTCSGHETTERQTQTLARCPKCRSNELMSVSMKNDRIEAKCTRCGEGSINAIFIDSSPVEPLSPHTQAALDIVARDLATLPMTVAERRCIHGKLPTESCEPCWQMGGKIYGLPENGDEKQT